VEKSKYHIRVMRPTYERAILTVEAASEESAICAALELAGRLTGDEWRVFQSARELPLVEIALSEDEADGSDAAIRAFLNDVQHAYALLQANLAEGSGGLIVPSWLRRQPDLAIADVIQDWCDALSGIYREGVDSFINWLGRQMRPTHVVKFFAERDKRRGQHRGPPDGT
jgi:hypothetical protein